MSILPASNHRVRLSPLGAHLLVLVTWLATLSPTPAHAQAASAEDLAAIIEAAQPEPGEDSLGVMTIEELMRHFGVPGVSVAVIRDFEIHWAKGYGIADVETGAPVTVQTLFQAGSISKPVAAMGTLKAVQDGLFSLDDDINDILTSWRLDGGEFTRDRPVTPRTLTSHTSGLGDGFGYPGYDPAGPIPTLVQTLDGHELANTGPVFMERPPMTFAEYSGGGTSVMQQALSDARTRPFAELMRDEVLEPLGMTASTYEQPLSPAWDRQAARAHDVDGRSMGAKWHVYPEMAAAGLWTTATDLARFAIEVQQSAVGRSNRVLSRATVMEMLTPVGVGSFAVGFVISQRGEGWYFGHSGSDWGFNADLLAHRSKGYGYAIMTNGDGGRGLIREVTRRIQTAYRWDSMAEPAPRGYAALPADGGLRVDEARLRAYVGTWEFPIATLDVRLDGGRLHARVEAFDADFPMLAESAERFVLQGIGARLIFSPDGDGEVTEAILELSGKGQPGRRVDGR